MSPSAVTMASNVSKKHMPNGILTTAAAHNQISINLTDGISPALLSATSAATAMPLNLNIKNDFSSQAIGHSAAALAAANGLQIISTGKNGMRQQMIELSDQNGAVMSVNGKNAKDQIKMESLTSKIDSEPPTKVIKLINGNTIALATVDKDNKLIPSNQLTLSQMVVSQIPLIASSQGLRVIGQPPNGLALELPNGNNIQILSENGRSGRTNCHPISTFAAGRHPNQVQATTAIQPNGTNGAQLHKLLVSGAPTNITSPVITSTIVNGKGNASSELARLPGGAELNILPTGTTSALYQRNGKLIVNNGLTTIKGQYDGKHDGDPSEVALCRTF